MARGFDQQGLDCEKILFLLFLLWSGAQFKKIITIVVEWNQFINHLKGFEDKFSKLKVEITYLHVMIKKTFVKFGKYFMICPKMRGFVCFSFKELSAMSMTTMFTTNFGRNKYLLHQQSFTNI